MTRLVAVVDGDGAEESGVRVRRHATPPKLEDPVAQRASTPRALISLFFARCFIGFEFPLHFILSSLHAVSAIPDDIDDGT